MERQESKKARELIADGKRARRPGSKKLEGWEAGRQVESAEFVEFIGFVELGEHVADGKRARGEEAKKHIAHR